MRVDVRCAMVPAIMRVLDAKLIMLQHRTIKLCILTHVSLTAHLVIIKYLPVSNVRHVMIAVFCAILLLWTVRNVEIQVVLFISITVINV